MLFWDNTGRRVVIPYRRFGTTYRCHIQGSGSLDLFDSLRCYRYVVPKRRYGSITLLLPLALRPAVGFGLSNNVLPLLHICHQLCLSSHSQHLKISLSTSYFHISWVYLVFFRPSSFNLSSFFLCSTFVTISFIFSVLLVPCQTPNLDDQGIHFCLGHHLRPVWHGRPYQ